MQDVLLLDDLSRIFTHEDAPVRAVDGVSLAIRANEFFTLLGPSGCGKTTILRLIAGLEKADGGKIILGGENIAALPAHKRPVNTVFQNYALFPHMSVVGNISFGPRMQGQPKNEIEKSLKEVLRLTRMEGLENRKPAQLSGGQQQRVALARALINHPKILLLDESLSALDFKLRKEMQRELKRLQRETGITFIFVTHDQDEALSMSDRIAVMNAGKIAQVGMPEDIYRRPASRYVADFIGVCNFADAGAFGLPKGEIGFRPEDASFEKSQLSAPGELLQITYRGPVTHYLVRLDGGEEVTLSLNERQNLETGARVHVGVNAERLIRCAA